MIGIALPAPRSPRARRTLLWLAMLFAVLLAGLSAAYVRSAQNPGVPIVPCKTCANCACPKTLGALKCLCPR